MEERCGGTMIYVPDDPEPKHVCKIIFDRSSNKKGSIWQCLTCGDSYIYNGIKWLNQGDLKKAQDFVHSVKNPSLVKSKAHSLRSFEAWDDDGPLFTLYAFALITAVIFLMIAITVFLDTVIAGGPGFNPLPLTFLITPAAFAFLAYIRRRHIVRIVKTGATLNVLENKFGNSIYERS